MKTKSHLIFDIDGTLWDSTERVAEAFNSGIKDDPRVAAYYPLTAGRLKKEFGLPLHVIGHNLFPDLPREQSDQLIDYLCDLEEAYLRKHPPETYAGAPETIRELSEYHDLYIVSNCQAGYAETFLDVTGLAPYFRDHLCPGDTGLLKAENIALIMNRYQIDKAVYIGDTNGDLLAARKAGVMFIHAAYGFGEVPEADASLSSITDLKALYL